MDSDLLFSADDTPAADELPSTSSSLAAGAGGDRRVKLFCSYGGKFLPRPSDNSLRYAGGKNRIITVRRDSTLQEILQKMAEACEGPAVLRYQLPDEGLCSLISVLTPEDLENMMEEHDKLVAKDDSAKLRVYLSSPSEAADVAEDQEIPPCDQEQNTRYVDAYVEAVNAVDSNLQRKGSLTSFSSIQNSDSTNSAELAMEGPLLSLSPTTATSNDQRLNFAPECTLDLLTATDSIDLNELMNATQPALPPLTVPYLPQAYINSHPTHFRNPQFLLPDKVPLQLNVFDVPAPSHTSIAQVTLPPASQHINAPLHLRAEPNLVENSNVGKIPKLPSDPKLQLLSQTIQSELPTPLTPYLPQAYSNSYFTQLMDLESSSPTETSLQLNVLDVPPLSNLPLTQGAVPLASQRSYGSLHMIANPNLEENSNAGKITTLPDDAKIQLLSQPPPLPPPRLLAPSGERNGTRQVAPPLKSQTLRLEESCSSQKGLSHVHSGTLIDEKVDGFGCFVPVNKMTLQSHHPEDMARMQAAKMVTTGMPVDNVVEPQAQAGNLVGATPLGSYGLTESTLEAPCNNDKVAAFIAENLDHAKTLGQPSLMGLQDPYLPFGFPLNPTETCQEGFIEKKPEMSETLEPNVESCDHSYLLLQPSSLVLSSHPSGVLTDISLSNCKGAFQEETQVPQTKIAENLDHAKTLAQPSSVGLTALSHVSYGTAKKIDSIQKKSVQPQTSDLNAIYDHANLFLQPTPGVQPSNPSGVLIDAPQSHWGKACQEQQQFPHVKTNVKQEEVAKKLVSNGSFARNSNLQVEGQVIHESVPIYSNHIRPVEGMMEIFDVNPHGSSVTDNTNPVVNPNSRTVKNSEPEILQLVVENNPTAKSQDGSNAIPVSNMHFNPVVGSDRNTGLSLDPLLSASQNFAYFENPSPSKISHILQLTGESGPSSYYHEPVVGAIGMPPSVNNDILNNNPLSFQPKEALNDITMSFGGNDHFSCGCHSSNMEPVKDQTLSDFLLFSGAGSEAIGIPSSVHNGIMNNNPLSFQPKEVLSDITMPESASGHFNHNSHTSSMEPVKDQTLDSLFFSEAGNGAIGIPSSVLNCTMNNNALRIQPKELLNAIGKPLSGNGHLSSSSQTSDMDPVKDQTTSDSLFVNDDPQNILAIAPTLPSRSADVATKDSVGMMGVQSDISSSKEKRSDISALPEDVSWLLPDSWNKELYAEVAQQLKDNQHIEQDMKASAEGKVAPGVHLSNSSIPGFIPCESSELNPQYDDGVIKENNVVLEEKVTETTDSNKHSEKANNSFGFPNVNDIERLQVIKNSDLEELQELGSGTYGTVYHGKWRGSDVAIKRLNDRAFAAKESDQEQARADFRNEACKLASLHHPNVLAFYGIVLDGPGGSIATITEFMVNGSLRNALQKTDKTLDKRTKLLIAMDAAFGMEYLHSKNIIHFDLKSDNLLVNLRDPQRPVCKVGDLGLSKVRYETLKSNCMRGTLPYMAPELLGGKVTEKIDVFSFGIVMWELLTCEEPYSDLHYGVILGGIIQDTLRPSVPESCDPEWRSLMEQCWASEPTVRPTFTEVASRLRSMEASLPRKG